MFVLHFIFTDIRKGCTEKFLVACHYYLVISLIPIAMVANLKIALFHCPTNDWMNRVRSKSMNAVQNVSMKTKIKKWNLLVTDKFSMKSVITWEIERYHLILCETIQITNCLPNWIIILISYFVWNTHDCLLFVSSVGLVYNNLITPYFRIQFGMKKH